MARCKEKAWPFPAGDDGLCNYHRNDLSMTESLVDLSQKSTVAAVWAGELRRVQRRFFWEYYKQWDSEGRCVYCGGVRDNHTKGCSDCRSELKEMWVNLRLRRKQNGLCPQCGGLLGREETYCEDCLRRGRRRYAHKLIVGLCGCCGQPREQLDRVFCSKCRAKVAVRSAVTRPAIRNARRVAGKCTGCGRDRDRDGNLCERCARRYLTNAVQFYRRRREAGLCVKCGRFAGRRVHCIKCRQEGRDRSKMKLSIELNHAVVPREKFTRTLGRKPYLRKIKAQLFGSDICSVFGPGERIGSKKLVYWNFVRKPRSANFTIFARIRPKMKPSKVTFNLAADSGAKSFYLWVVDRLGAVDNGDEAQ